MIVVDGRVRQPLARLRVRAFELLHEGVELGRGHGDTKGTAVKMRDRKLARPWLVAQTLRRITTLARRP